SELILENATKGVTGGVLVNTWDGRTAFTLTPSLTGFWKTTGNAGLTDANFIGTTDLKNLWFRVNNTKSGGIDVIYANASLGMGSMGSN
ncbi:hypothetical protein M3M33_14650, partial [Loigolactobacillus coryniformis]|uniref:hypothetical protein n=1 Tax=Loigolactobacillus coryniformis TaxID=1610 RepID=UPI00201A7B82